MYVYVRLCHSFFSEMGRLPVISVVIFYPFTSCVVGQQTHKNGKKNMFLDVLPFLQIPLKNNNNIINNNHMTSMNQLCITSIMLSCNGNRHYINSISRHMFAYQVENIVLLIYHMHSSLWERQIFNCLKN